MQSLRIGIIAAEPSGDLLAAGLMRALKSEMPSVQFEGVAGPLMVQEGIDVWEPMDSISVMGLFEVLPHLARLLRLRSRIAARWRDTPPAVFIGVDAPDFNLSIESDLRASGVPTVHYVCPTVWAWRTGRVKKIRRAVDLLLTIFPFEEAFLARHQVAAHYVGHPLAGEMPMHPDQAAARRQLGLTDDSPVLAVLPGSRGGEVDRLTRPFLQTAGALQQEMPALQIVVPLVNEKTRVMFDRYKAEFAPSLDVQVVVGEARKVMAAADVILTASGTATLEGLLSKRPMVVGHKVQAATYWLARLLNLVKVPHIAMANLLADDRLAPEFIQHECEPRYLLPPLRRFFAEQLLREQIAARYTEIHRSMRSDTNREAAAAVIALMKERGIV